jgi:2-C-methyl-D-erythritol 4-phosphate cytidylyltransferase/2-C-methyl-D-erythritol 2,4-cyclodiphosphate synthase
MRIGAVIVAAGTGSRAGGEKPKQYQVIGGRPVVWWALKSFCDHPSIAHIQPVIGAGQDDLFASATQGLTIDPPVIGGETRQESCRRGLEAIARHQETHILIHDAARPFVSADLISRVIAGLQQHQSAIPGLAIADTVKKAPFGTIERTIDRTGLWTVQTPQGFAFEAIRAAHEKAIETGQSSLTDDAAVAELAGLEVAIIPGDAENRKMTTAADLAEADRTLSASLNDLPDIRTGFGIDIHPFADGDHVMLCGVSIPHTHKLAGHSDADAALHALTDAILGAIGEGDIGTHFPPSDPQWRGAASAQFLAFAAERVRVRGGRIDHLDLTIVCEAPKIGPHRDAIRGNIARLAGIDASRVAVKATTSEKLGFTGRSEGIVAYATATVRLPWT